MIIMGISLNFKFGSFMMCAKVQQDIASEFVHIFGEIRGWFFDALQEHLDALLDDVALLLCDVNYVPDDILLS